MRLSKIVHVLKEEVQAVHLRYQMAQFWVSLLPHNALNRVRTVIYRVAGLKIGNGTVIMGAVTLVGTEPIASMLEIGANCRINSPLYIELTAPVKIGNDVGIGHHVVLITTDHQTGDSASRAGMSICSPITIDAGAWIGAGSTILPGVTVGAGAVVAAGSLVTQSVLPNRVVGGVPARVVKNLTG
jgi:maltose O-acetyltransferase